jgi:hypothetical protein
MRRCLIIFAMLPAACGPDPQTIIATPPVPADLLAPAPGWTGRPPATEGQLIDAAAAEKRGRLICNGQLLTIADIITPAP